MGIFDRISRALRPPKRRMIKLAPWFDAVAPAVRAAFDVAERDGKRVADLSDLLWALSFEDEVEQLLLRLASEIEPVRDALSLARSPADGNDSESPDDVVLPHDVVPDNVTVAVLRHAAAQVAARGGKAVSATDVFLAALHATDTAACSALERFNITRFSVTMMLSHGVSAHRLALADYSNDDEVLVVMWNDNFTTMEFVLETLGARFGMDEGEAKGVMMEVHNHGRATVAIWEASRAKEAVIEVLAKAKDAGCPLRLTLERAHQ